jgi:cytochrome c-type biogenesis protein CcmF
VENGSLIPWLLGTAFLHAALAWRSRGIFKKTAIALAIATFACCNFAAFITRSGFFSSLHAFNQSPLGAMFLVLMAVIAIGGASLLLWRRAAYAGDRSLTSFWSRESWTAIFIVIMVLSAALVAIGTLVAPVSGILVGRRIAMEAAFYNKAMLPIGLLLVFATALAPLLRWGASPRISESRAIPLSLAAAVATVGVAWLVGLRHPVALTVAGLTGFGVAALVATLFLDVQRRGTAVAWRHLVAAISGNRRQYAGFLVHLGFLCLAVGITGSSRGTHRQDAAMRERETYAWSDWTIRLTRLTQQNSAGEITVSAHLEISRGGRPPFVLRPAQVFHECSNEWTGKTAIRSTWTEDFFVILQNGEAGGKVNLTFVENPLMRWIWFGGCIAGLGAIGGLLPAKRIARSRHCVPRPHLIAKSPIAQPPRSRVAHG